MKKKISAGAMKVFQHEASAPVYTGGIGIEENKGRRRAGRGMGLLKERGQAEVRRVAFGSDTQCL